MGKNKESSNSLLQGSSLQSTASGTIHVLNVKHILQYITESSLKELEILALRATLAKGLSYAYSSSDSDNKGLV